VHGGCQQDGLLDHGPVQTGQILLLGRSFQESALQEQKILVVVLSWMWVSSPITVSYSVMGHFSLF
jgi:hypothetical protein